MRLVIGIKNHEIRRYCYTKDCDYERSWYDARVHEACPGCGSKTPKSNF